MRKEIVKEQTMQEEFLHYLWEKGFEKRSLKTVSGEKVTIINTGEHNRDAGPDYVNAIVRIGDTTWAGSVEIHVKASDWARHGHGSDSAYDNVILHAVHEYDTPVYRTSGEEISAITMKEHIPVKAYAAYQDYLNNHLWIPCAGEISQVPGSTVQSHLEKLCIDRIGRRASGIARSVADYKGDWGQAFLISLAGSLGTRINKEPFEILARQTPIQVILKCRPDLSRLEALFFGQAGLLDRQYREEYPITLSREYDHLKKKHSLEGTAGHLWKFLRLRPVNFPTVRLAQLSAIYHRCPFPLGSLIDEKDPDNWDSVFSVSASEYWNTHYQFDRISPESIKSVGQDTVDLIMINTVIPFLYAFGRSHNNQEMADKSLAKLASISPERNSVTLRFNAFGLEFSNAWHTQGSLELKKHWCDLRRCLDCKFGHELLRLAL
jgi:hypothetical protein